MLKTLLCVTTALLLTTQAAASRTVTDRNETSRQTAHHNSKAKKAIKKKKWLSASQKAKRALKAKRQAKYRRWLEARQEALEDAEDAREDAREAARAALRRQRAKERAAAVPIQTDIWSFRRQEPVFVEAPTHTPSWGIFDVFREFLERTPVRGGTMQRQGFDVALGYLHPLFRERLARAIWQAQGEGFYNIGVFSGYRKPSLGVGGFGNKELSCHAYGLAVDMAGIGGPGSRQAIRWHEIARDNSIYCPYGPYNGAEWNHCQLVPHKVCGSYAVLRKTITRDGPKDPEAMWKASADLPKIALAKMMSRKPHKRKYARRNDD